MSEETDPIIEARDVLFARLSAAADEHLSVLERGMVMQRVLTDIRMALDAFRAHVRTEARKTLAANQTNFAAACEAFGVDAETVTMRELKARWRATAFDHHTDRCKAPDAAERFAHLHQLYTCAAMYIEAKAKAGKRARRA